MTRSKQLAPVGAVFLFLLGLPCAPPLKAQKPADEAVLAEAKKILEQAQKEIEGFQKSGGKNSDPKHPAVKWSQRLWDFRARAPGTEAAGFAAAESIHVLIHADRIADGIRWAETLPPGDPAWERLPGHLVEAASLQKDYSYVIRKLNRLVRAPPAEKHLPAIYCHLGRAYRANEEPEAAKSALEAVIRVAPDSSRAKEAQGLLYELTKLAIGQPAPALVARARNGSPISLADFRGKAVLLIFWAST